MAKVAMVTPYYHPVVGGISTFVEGLASAIRRRGCEVRIFTQFGEPARDVEVGPQDSLRFVRWTRDRLTNWSPDAVHAHAHWYALAGSMRRASSIAPRTVFTIHTDLGGLKNPASEFYLRRLFGRADVVTAVSGPSLTRFLARFAVKGHSEVMRPGVRELHASFQEVAEVTERYSLKDRFPRLSVISMMSWPEKARGLGLAIRSMGFLRDKFPGARLVVVGDGELRGSLERSAKEANVDQLVTFAGSQQNPAPFILASDVLVHISFQETLSQTVLEALSLGRPVVVNREIIGNFPDLPETHGIVSVRATPEEIAGGVAMLAAGGSIQADLSRSAVEYVSHHFNWDATANRAMEIYGLR